MKRRLMIGTGWKMNHLIAETRSYARVLRPHLDRLDCSAVDIFVLPPFTALAAAAESFAGTPVRIGAQNMHGEESGAWTGEISAGMLAEAGCHYVELAHSERLRHFNERYAFVRGKVNAALNHDLVPVLCLGETAEEKAAGQADRTLAQQLETALADVDAVTLPRVVLAYEPRWAIGAAQAAPARYAEDRHRHIRDCLAARWGAPAAGATRIIYGGSVTLANGRELVRQENIDGLFVGRAAWTPEGFARLVGLVVETASTKGTSK
jgi:triosephosphate isomerase